MGGAGGGEELFGVGQDALFGLKPGVFVFGGERCTGDFGALKTPQVGHSEAVLLRGFEFAETPHRGVPLRKCGGHGFGRELAEAVEKLTTLSLVEGAHGLALGVDEGEFGCELAEHGDGGGLVVDEDAAFAGGCDLATKQDCVFVIFGVDAVVFEEGSSTGSGVEGACR